MLLLLHGKSILYLRGHAKPKTGATSFIRLENRLRNQLCHREQRHDRHTICNKTITNRITLNGDTNCEHENSVVQKTGSQETTKK